MLKIKEKLKEQVKATFEKIMKLQRRLRKM